MKKRSSLILFLEFVLGLWLTGMMPGLALAAESPTTEAFTFVQICDTQLGYGGYDHDVNSFKQAVSHINSLKPDLVFICGDLVQTFSSTSVADYLQIKSGLTMPSYNVAGNHDIGNSPTVSSLEAYRQALGDDYYSLEHKGYTFVIVNSTLWKAPVAGESEKQDAWLKQTLEATRDKNSPIFMVQHHPLYLTSPDEAENHFNLPLAKRSELLALFENCGVVAVLSGHTHQLFINEYKGIQMVAGEATSKNNDGSPLGFRLWHVDSPTSIRHEFRPLVPEMRTVDLNGDFIVDIEDLIILIEFWGTDEPMCDIAPRPFFDGIVDVLDLELLMSYWGQEIPPPELIAYWKLDETEGDIAYDSVGEHDGTLNGEPLWQPEGSMVDGAIELDGIDDYISTPFVIDPADGPLSVFAWIKGGAPGQVILSQKEAVDWLLADPSDGKLMTALSKPAGGRIPPTPLVSESIITDNAWHRIGLTWDGSSRTLYVDDVEVATDAQGTLEGSTGGLYIGAGKNLEAGSFFSGLIDDVKIYNRAVIP